MSVLKIVLLIALVGLLVYQCVSLVKVIKKKRAAKKATQEDKNIDKEV